MGFGLANVCDRQGPSYKKDALAVLSGGVRTVGSGSARLQSPMCDAKVRTDPYSVAKSWSIEEKLGHRTQTNRFGQLAWGLCDKSIRSASKSKLHLV